MNRLAAAFTLVLVVATSFWRLAPGDESLPASDLSSPPEDRAGAEPIRPIEPFAPLDAARVALGGRLFRDPRLSGDGTVSCATCHDLRRGGVDLLPQARGAFGAMGARNTPTVYNAWRNPVQLWDGRADSLEAQIGGPLTSPVELGSSWPEALQAISADADYVRRFAASYPGGISQATVTDAIATFERSLTTSGSRFDRFLRGDLTALSRDEQDGYRAFKSYGCASCHQGANVGGNLYERLGVFEDYFADGGPDRPVDLGRYAVTGLEEDRHLFRVPSLRLAAVTPPYFHDGAVATLEEAVRIMARYQVGREIEPLDVRRIVQFLNTLPGEEVVRGAE